MINPFAPNYDYINDGISIQDYSINDITNMKMEALEKIREEVVCEEQRIVTLTQILSLSHIEIPYLIYHSIDLDIDSIHILSNHLVQRVCKHYLDHELYDLKKRFEEVPKNRLLFLLSDHLLYTICNTLYKPLDNIMTSIVDADLGTLAATQEFLIRYHKYTTKQKVKTKDNKYNYEYLYFLKHSRI
ncbi:MAG TPA: hypothetical protein DF712_06800 [Balneola sp.]|nr:hypothetical protein [Balneola sp.]|tara:strand:+ start:1022 stop:1582 length:561 start_codon:yes stop_codon:yes gene_type:complete